MARIRQLAFTDKGGTSILGLVQAFKKLGFDAKGVRGELDSLQKIPKPAVAHVILKEVLHHYVVIYKVTNNHIYVMDPAEGTIRQYRIEQFKAIWTGVLVIVLPGDSFQRGNQKQSNALRFWSLIRPHKGVMLQALVGAMVYTIIGLATAIYVQKTVDYVLVDGNRNLLNLMSVIMVALLLLQQFVGSMKSIFILRVGQAIDADLISGYYKQVLNLPRQFFDSLRTGEIISRINDAVRIRSFINEGLATLVVNVFILVFSFLLMFTYYWKLALIVLLMIPFYGIIYYAMDRSNKAVERRLMENAAALESQWVESLNAINTIRSYGLEEHAQLRMDGRLFRLLKTVYTSGLNTIYSGSLTEFISRSFTIVLLWVGANFVLQTELTPGELLSFYSLAGYFTAPVSSMMGQNKILRSAIIAADRLFEIMDVASENEQHRVELATGYTGSIVFKNVSFCYGARMAVIENLNLEIPQSCVTAIVGESGSGKSTLMALLQKLYPPTSGSILIGQHDLKYIGSDSLRNQVAVVPQQIDLFAGNVIDNIAVGDQQPNVARILSLCSALGILDFIEALPKGFSTWLGENGCTLSAGQKQRIAIARALYKNPSILILDEATSSLDSMAEDYIWKMINVMRENRKTVIIITHRLSALVQADKIVVLERGKIAEEGRHEELIENRGAYFKLWTRHHRVA